MDHPFALQIQGFFLTFSEKCAEGPSINTVNNLRGKGSKLTTHKSKLSGDMVNKLDEIDTFFLEIC